jgi:4-amino-4-deoxy-L-arabinose transferase-like glycosyltransferase
MARSCGHDDEAIGNAATAQVEREPARLLAWLLAAHVIVWTVLPILVCRNLQLDLAEGLALGREWQLGYWKHPPLPWWIDALAWRFTGDVRIVYALGPLASAIALYAVWRLGRDVVGPRCALIAVLLLEGLHFFNFSAVKFNHDVLQLPLWALTGLLVFRALRDARRLDWVLAGAVLALAMWTKYSTLALAASIGLFLIVDPVARRAWRTPGPYLMGLSFLLVLAPHVAWLIDSDFQPLRYADMRAVVAIHWYQWITFPLRWVASQVFFLLPVLALLALATFNGRARRLEDDGARFARRYVTMLALGPFLIVTLGAALTGRLPVALWGYPLWSFAPLAVLAWRAPSMPAPRLFWPAVLAVLLAMPLAYAADELLEPLVRDRPKATDFPGRALADTVTRQWRAATGTPLVYVAGADFPSSGAGEFAANTVAVYSDDHPHVVVHGELAFSPWVDPADLVRRGAVLIWEGVGSLPPNLRATFPAAELQPPLTLPRQTLYPRRPAVINWAIAPPHP